MEMNTIRPLHYTIKFIFYMIYPHPQKINLYMHVFFNDKVINYKTIAMQSQHTAVARNIAEKL